MADYALDPEERHNHRLASFARWLIAVVDADEVERESIITMARRLNAGGMSRADTLTLLRELDQLLTDVMAAEWVPSPSAPTAD